VPVLVLVCVVARAGRAAEETPQPQGDAARQAATARLIEGVDLLRMGRYQAALGKFDEAYALVPSPNIHYDRGLAYRGLGWNAAAIEAFDAFLTGAQQPPEGKREQARRYFDELRPRVARLEVASEPMGAEVSVDGRGYGPTPLGRAIYLDPGRHELRARNPSSGAISVEPVVAAAGQSLKVTLTLARPMRVAAESKGPPPLVAPAVSSPPHEVSAVSQPSPTEPQSRARTWTMVAAGGGLALLGAGLTFELIARHYSNALTDDSRRGQTAPVTFVPAKEDSGLEFQTLGYVFLGVGAAVLAGSTVVYALQRRHASESQAQRRPVRAAWTMTGAPIIGPALAGARVRFSF
jgi:hypothetical protein